MNSGYTQCSCCGDDTISQDMSEPELCLLCEEAGCEHGDWCLVELEAESGQK